MVGLFGMLRLCDVGRGGGSLGGRATRTEVLVFSAAEVELSCGIVDVYDETTKLTVLTEMGVSKRIFTVYYF
jgi:hypothetical protein